MSFYVDSNKHQERFIYVIVARNKLVRAFSDKAMAWNACKRMRDLESDPQQVLNPIGVLMIDSQAINSKPYDRIDTGY